MKKEIIEFNQSQKATKAPDLRTGEVVRVHRKIIEGGKERIQVFEGMIIAVKGKQSFSPTITVRKVSEGIGVEIIVPVKSPRIAKIEIVRKARVRRSKLYYIRTKPTKSLRLKYKELSQFAKVEEKKETEIEGVKNEEKVEN